MFEGLLPGDIVAESAAVSSLVEGIADGVILFLASCVPDLDGDDCVVNYNLLFLEVSTYGWLHLGRCLSLSVPH